MTHPQASPENAIPSIPPLSPGARRPFWSVMILAVANPEYLKKAITSVLEQDAGVNRMQIEVIADRSTPVDVQGLVQQVGGDRVTCFFDEKQAGRQAMLHNALLRAAGHWIHVLPGQHWVTAGFYESARQQIHRHPGLSLLFGPSIQVDAQGAARSITASIAGQEGPIADFALRQSLWNQVCPAAAIVPRWVYERVGGFDRSLEWGDDWEMWFRAAAAGFAVWAGFPRSVCRTEAPSHHFDPLPANWRWTDATTLIERLTQKLSPADRPSLPPQPYQELAQSLVTLSHFYRRMGRPAQSLAMARAAVRLDRNGEAIAELGQALRIYPWTQGRLSGALGVIGKALGSRKRAAETPAPEVAIPSPPAPAVSAPPQSADAVRARQQAIATAHGIQILYEGKAIRIRRHADEIRIDAEHPTYIHDMIVGFDYYFSAVYPVETAEGRVADYSTPRVHRLRRSGVEFEFPSLPESDETTEIYHQALDIHRGDAILDLGAYAGASAYFLSAAVGPEGLIAAFEPDKINARHLRANVARHHLSNVRVFEKGIWRETGTISFQTEGNLGSAVEEITRRSSHAVSVEVASLQDAARLAGARRISGVKMDIEGAELEVLRHAGEFLRQHRPRLVIEPHSVHGSMNTDALRETLEGFDYDVELVRQGSLDWPLLVAVPRSGSAIPALANSVPESPAIPGDENGVDEMAPVGADLR